MEHHDTPEPRSDTAINGVFDDFLRTFAHFKETNDQRLDELEKRAADPLTADKLARIDRTLDSQKRALDEFAHKALRSRLDSPDGRQAGAPEHKAAFEGYVRKGDVTPLSRLESKALSVGSEADGGYLVPPVIENAVNQSLRSLSPIRGISTVQQVSSTVYKRPFSISGAGAGWIGETAPRPQTVTPGLTELAFPTMELYAMPAATPTLLEDAVVDIDQWLAGEVHSAFAIQEGSAFVSGDGVSKPKGFLAYPTAVDSTWKSK